MSLRSVWVVLVLADPTFGWGSEEPLRVSQRDGVCDGVPDDQACAQLERSDCNLPDVGPEIKENCKDLCDTCPGDVVYRDRSCNGVEDAAWCRASQVVDGRRVFTYPCNVGEPQYDDDMKLFYISQKRLNKNPFLDANRAQCPFRCQTCVDTSSSTSTPTTTTTTQPPGRCEGKVDPPKCGLMTPAFCSADSATLQIIANGIKNDCPVMCNTCGQFFGDKTDGCAYQPGRKRSRKCFGVGEAMCNGKQDPHECSTDTIMQHCDYDAIPALRDSIRLLCPSTCNVCPETPPPTPEPTPYPSPAPTPAPKIAIDATLLGEPGDNVHATVYTANCVEIGACENVDFDETCKLILKGSKKDSGITCAGQCTLASSRCDLQYTFRDTSDDARSRRVLEKTPRGGVDLAFVVLQRPGAQKDLFKPNAGALNGMPVVDTTDPKDNVADITTHAVDTSTKVIELTDDLSITAVASSMAVPTPMPTPMPTPATPVPTPMPTPAPILCQGSTDKEDLGYTHSHQYAGYFYCIEGKVSGTVPFVGDHGCICKCKVGSSGKHCDKN